MVIGDVEMSLLFDVFCLWMQLVNETEDRYWENLLFWFVNLAMKILNEELQKKNKNKNAARTNWQSQ